MENLRHPALKAGKARLCVRGFGNFEVYQNNEPLMFSRTRAKEVFAYLIFKRGSACSWQDVASVLYEDEPFGLQQSNRIRQLIVSLTQALREAVLIERRNSIAVDPGQIDCDYYRFLNMDVGAINSSPGEFMAQYEWAIFVVGFWIVKSCPGNSRRGGKRIEGVDYFCDPRVPDAPYGFGYSGVPRSGAGCVP